MHHNNYWSAHPTKNREKSIFANGNSPDHNQYQDNVWDVFPEQTVDVLGWVQVPVVGYKVLAAGTIPAKDGFNNAFEGAANFLCVGMFDFQVVEDVNLASERINGNLNGKRPWYS